MERGSEAVLYLVGFIAGVLFGVKYYLKRVPFTEEEIQRVKEMGEEPPKSTNPNRKIRPRKKPNLILESILLGFAVFVLTQVLVVFLLFGARLLGIGF